VAAAEVVDAGGSGREFDAIGNRALLKGPLLALACSGRCPPGLVLRAYDLASALRDSGIAVVGGFHTAIERDCLHFLLKGSQPVVVCPARGVAGMRVPAEWKGPLAEGRLLIVSRISGEERRVTAALAAERNRFVAKLAGAAVVVHAAKGSRTEDWCRVVMGMGKSVWTLDAAENGHLVEMGARVFDVGALPRLFG
jgi:predicted Rossmann fold nucleotide-binding protein DprA/Smf involved in DNA uptake